MLIGDKDMKLSQTCAVSGMLAKLKDAPIVPVCITAASVGLLSGIILGFVFSPVKHGIVIGSYNRATGNTAIGKLVH